MVAIRLIKEVSPEIEHEQYWELDPDQPGLTKSRVYDAYETYMYWRLRAEPSLKEGILGESSKVRHFAAYQLVEFIQRQEHEDDDDDVGLKSRAWQVVLKIKSFAPDLVAADECVEPWDFGACPWARMDPWPIIRRLIVATAWAR